MYPVSFNESDAFLGPPVDRENGDTECLSIKRIMIDENTPAVVSCWKPTKEELAQITKTGRIWLHVMGSTMPPVAIEGFSPFEAMPATGQ